MVDMCPDRTGRKIPRAQDPAKIKLQIGIASSCVTVVPVRAPCSHVSILSCSHAGSLQIDCLGKLKELSDTPTHLLPDKFRYILCFYT